MSLFHVTRYSFYFLFFSNHLNALNHVKPYENRQQGPARLAYLLWAPVKLTGSDSPFLQKMSTGQVTLGSQTFTTGRGKSSPSDPILLLQYT